MSNLAVLYIKGDGVAQSNELAREWWNKSANEGHEGAITNLKQLDKLEGKPTTAPSTTTTAPPSHLASHVCCSSCNKPQSSGQTFRKCRGCRTVQYCNKECQRAHWSPGGHKQECKRLRKKKEEEKGSSSSQNKTSKST
jgi:TPR repeat protein